MVTLTSGIFLVAFALALGASNTVIGLLAAIPPLAELIQLPSIWLVERIRNRRALCVSFSIIARAFWLIIAAIPFLFPGRSGIVILLVSMCCYAGLSAVSHCSWNSWMRDLIPGKELGSFFSGRLRVSTGLAIVLSLAAAVFLDYWQSKAPNAIASGYSAIFFTGWVAGMAGVYFLGITPETKLHRREEFSFKKILTVPFQDANFKKLLSFLGSWNFAVNLAAPFFTVYMLQRLSLDISWVIALAVLSQLISISMYRIWGNAADRFSHKSVLRVSGPLFMVAILAWTFTTLPGTYILTIPLVIMIHILTGISTAGVTLASGNIALKLAPQGSATSYLATSSITNSLAAGIAPIIGGLFADFFARRELSLTLTWIDPAGILTFQTLDFQQWDFFFFFAFCIGLYSLHRLAMVTEEGEITERIFITELIAEVRREMRNFSTAGGIRQVIRFPFHMVRQSRRGRNRHRQDDAVSTGEMKTEQREGEGP
jgi:MFS family permease